MSSDIFECKEHVAPGQHIRQYPRATSRSQEDVLQLAVKQYTPRDNPDPLPGDVTILACHASGFPKELYEPVWDELHRISKANGRFRIRSIWIADVANQGYSGVLNEHKLGNDPSYYDHARDMLQMVNHFRASLPRPLIGLGHSMGGCAMINLALMHPRLFSTIVIIEPIIESRVRELYKFNYMPYLLAFQPDLWPSREAAVKAMRSNALYKNWDPAVRSILEEHGLRQLPTAIYDESDGKSATTLMTTKHQELFSYARPSYPDPNKPLKSFTPTRASHPDLGSGKERDYDSIFYRPEAILTFTQLPFLRPTCLYIYGDKSALSTASKQTRHDKLVNTGTAVGGSGGVAEGAVKEVVVDGDHFVPFQRPKEIASIASDWMASELKRWNMLEEADARVWAAVDFKDRARIDEDMEYWMKQNYANRPRPAASKSGKGKSSKL